MIPHTKRYMIILETWNAPYRCNVAEKVTRDEYDTIEEVEKDVEMIHEWYMKPSCMSSSETGFYWGYVILDFEDEKVLSIMHDGIQGYQGTECGCEMRIDDCNIPYLRLKDKAFRKDDEIPSDYVWRNDNEYVGWLQFRWGNGLNAVKYVTKSDGTKVKSTKLPSADDFINCGYYVDYKPKTGKEKKRLPRLIREDEF